MSALKGLKTSRVARVVCLFWLGASSASALWMASASTHGRAVPLSDGKLATITGGEDPRNCCVNGSGVCPGYTNGCQNSGFKCAGPNSCPKSGQQIQHNIYGPRYPDASCAQPQGDISTIDQPQIDCYVTVTCPSSCTSNGAYFYCDAGGNPIPGPKYTPTIPDNVYCQ